MSEKFSQFKIGGVVRVKDGITDPDDPQIDWSGWHGRLTDLSRLDQEKPTILIGLDSITIRSLPVEYIEECEEQGLGWSELYVYSEDVDLVAPRDEPWDAKKAQNELSALHGWASLGEQGKRIQAVLGKSVLDGEWAEMLAWDDYLQRHLSFPFKAKVFDSQGRSPLRIGDRLSVLSIEDTDESYGVIVECRKGRKQYYFPLADLKAVDRKSPNYPLVDDFGVWFSNR